MKVELGDKVKDSVTGYSGIVVCIGKWLHGCERVTVQPTELKDGKPIEAVTFDMPQLKIVNKSVHPGTSIVGGPNPEPRQKANPL